MAAAGINEQLQYEAQEPCSPLLALTVGLQGFVLVLAPTVLIVVITVRAASQDDGYLTWAVFAALIINAIITALQAGQFARMGAGLVVITGPTIQFVVVTAAAVSEGGPALLASLMLVSSLFQFALAAWLPFLRRIITPVVSGTVLMLIAVTVVPVAFARLAEVPDDAPAGAGPAVALATLVASTVLALRASGAWRLWSAFISIGVGTALAAALGMYDLQRVIDAPWVGIPEARFPGVDLTPGVEFWALLPTFAILTLVLGIKVISDCMIIQQASRRESRAVDFRQIQGALNANGAGMVLAGVAGTPPTFAYSSFSVSLISLTGVAARRVGYAIAAIFLVLAFFSKFAALLLTIPDPVMGAYLLLLLGLFFVGGMQTVVRDGLDAQKVLVVALAFAVGLGVDGQDILVEEFGETLGSLLGNGVMAGTLAAIVLTAFIEWTNPRPERLRAELGMAALPRVDEFLRGVAASLNWNEASTERLRSAGEETLSTLVMSEDGESPAEGARLSVTARPAGTAVDLEFVAATDQENLEDRIAYLSTELQIPEPNEVSLRLLRHYASAVRHQKYHGLDIVTVRVEGSPQ
ncbi:MAG: hypothetical protein F4Z25_10035 [Chloroflexi bacterium]|nr:hypothetical protein [Chloroflexota bacterium]